jgi:hypothetical protein
MSTIKDFNIYKDNFVVVHQGTELPQISVVMPVCNCEEFIVEAVTSVLAQQEVVAEIVISDDASTDNTFPLAYEVVVNYISKFELKHTVVMRIGTTRLVRDHLHLLADKASCDLVCQAHGDDVSHPLRCSTLVTAFDHDNKKATMIFSSALVIDAEGKVLETPNNLSLSDISLIPVNYKDIITAENELLVGSNMTWRKSAFKEFPSLTTSYCTYGHDRVMAFRGFLIGGCYILNAPLIKRRFHRNNLHKELISTDHKSITIFNNQLIRLAFFSAMKNDLIFLKEHNMIAEDNVDQICKNINEIVIQVTKFIASATTDLIIDGYVNKWEKNI